MSPGFDSQIRRQMWVEFVGSLLCTERFSPGTPVSPLLKKPKFDLIVLIVNLIYSVPNQRSSARKTRHLNKVPYLPLYSILSNNFCFTRLFLKKKKIPLGLAWGHLEFSRECPVVYVCWLIKPPLSLLN